MRKVVSILVGALVGAALTLPCSFAYADRVRIFGVLFPYGVVLVVLLLLIGQRWVVQLRRTRWAGFGFLIGWVLVTLVLATPTRGGDVAMPENLRTQGYLVAAALLLGTGAMLPARPRRHG